jgi:hypothetical protein
MSFIRSIVIGPALPLPPFSAAVFAQAIADSSALGVDWGRKFPSDGKTQMIVGLTGLGLRFNNVVSGAHLGR